MSDKNTIFSQICTEKNEIIISDDLDLSEESGTFFEDVVRSLNVKPDEYYLHNTENVSETLETVTRKFENHPSFQTISVNQISCFPTVEISDILKETTALNKKRMVTLVIFQHNI